MKEDAQQLTDRLAMLQQCSINSKRIFLKDSRISLIVHIVGEMVSKLRVNLRRLLETMCFFWMFQSSHLGSAQYDCRFRGQLH